MQTLFLINIFKRRHSFSHCQQYCAHLIRCTRHTLGDVHGLSAFESLDLWFTIVLYWQYLARIVCKGPSRPRQLHVMAMHRCMFIVYSFAFYLYFVSFPSLHTPMKIRIALSAAYDHEWSVVPLNCKHSRVFVKPYIYIYFRANDTDVVGSRKLKCNFCLSESKIHVDEWRKCVCNCPSFPAMGFWDRKSVV